MKKFLSLLLAVCMVLSLAACGKKNEPKEPDNQGVVTQDPIDVPKDTDDESTENLGDSDRVTLDIPSIVNKETEEPTESVDDGGNEEPGDPVDNSGDDEGDIEGEESGEDEESGEEEPSEEFDKSKLDADAGEKALFEKYFEGGATEQAIREMLHVNASQVSYEVIQETIVLLNEYSKEGIERFVEENNRFSGLSQDKQNAAVLVWRILDKDPKEIWEKDFMQERLVMAVWDTLDYAEEQYQKQLEQDKKGK